MCRVKQTTGLVRCGTFTLRIYCCTVLAHHSAIHTCQSGISLLLHCFSHTPWWEPWKLCSTQRGEFGGHVGFFKRWKKYGYNFLSAFYFLLYSFLYHLSNGLASGKIWIVICRDNATQQCKPDNRNLDISPISFLALTACVGWAIYQCWC